MANVAIQRVQSASSATVPLFQEIERRIEGVRRRAFELFEKRGHTQGHELDDWLGAEHEVMGWPAAELAETDGEYKLEMTLPGFDAKNVEVTATSDEIMVHANSTTEKKAEEARIIWTEFGSNDVYRRFQLPQPINVDRLSATLDHGLLKIIAAKAAGKAKSAAVTTAS